MRDPKERLKDIPKLKTALERLLRKLEELGYGG